MSDDEAIHTTARLRQQLSERKRAGLGDTIGGNGLLDILHHLEDDVDNLRFSVIKHHSAVQYGLMGVLSSGGLIVATCVYIFMSLAGQVAELKLGVEQRVRESTRLEMLSTINDKMGSIVQRMTERDAELQRALDAITRHMEQDAQRFQMLEQKVQEQAAIRGYQAPPMTPNR